MEMTVVKKWSSRTGALMHIDDCHPELEDAAAVRLPSVLNHDGWIVSEVWAIQRPDGTYISGQEEG